MFKVNNKCTITKLIKQVNLNDIVLAALPVTLNMSRIVGIVSKTCLSHMETSGGYRKQMIGSYIMRSLVANGLAYQSSPLTFASFASLASSLSSKLSLWVSLKRRYENINMRRFARFGTICTIQKT